MICLFFILDGYFFELLMKMWATGPLRHGPVMQGFSTTGPRTGTGQWLNQYRAAQELISYLCFIYYLSLGQ